MRSSEPTKVAAMGDTMDAAAALESATRLLHELSGPNDPNRLVIARAELRDKGWLFFYTSAAFLESRSFVDALGGANPILVTPDGAASTVPYDEIASRAGDPVHPGA